MDASSDFSKSITKSIILHYRTYSYSHDTARAITETANRASVHGTDERTACTTKILCPAEHAEQRTRQRPVCLSKRPVIKVASVGRVPNAADTVEKRGHRQPHGPAAGSARPSAWPTCHVSHPSMTPRSASVLPDAYTSGLSPVMLRMEPYTYPHFSRETVAGLLAFHIPSAHGKLRTQYIFHIRAGTGGGGETAS